jgi:hypothetical protein
MLSVRRVTFHRLMVPPLGEDVLFHVLIECLTHLVKVSLILGWHLLNLSDFCGRDVQLGAGAARLSWPVGRSHRFLDLFKNYFS